MDLTVFREEIHQLHHEQLEIREIIANSNIVSLNAHNPKGLSYPFQP
jgi:hypothetical protein